MGSHWEQAPGGATNSAATRQIEHPVVSHSTPGYRAGMPRGERLSKSMTLEAFDNGYWYATALRTFGAELGVPSAKKLRKDELEKAIRTFLTTGKIKPPTKRALSKSSVKDLDIGLSMILPVVHYTSNRETKSFIEREAQKLAPGLKHRPGVRYRLNRFREDQLTEGKKLTYGDLVRHYVALCQSDEPFAKMPHGRYINFLADFLANERGATHAQARAAWSELKRLSVPKDYRSWRRAKRAGLSER